MTPHDFVALIHVVGFLTGVALYGMLAFMSWRASREGTPSPTRALPVLAGVLGMVWNTGALLVFGWQDFELGAPSPWLLAIAYAALSLLPAVMLDSATRRPTESRWPAPAAIMGYAASLAACLLEGRAAFGDGTSRAAFLVLTLGYAAILVSLVLPPRRRAGGSPRTITVVALAAFAVSALHLSQHTSESDSWIIELIGHHASLGLVLVVLYQDYRFALADLFLKQAIAIVLLVAIAVGLYALVIVPMLPTAPGRVPVGTAAVLLAAWTGTALLYPSLRRTANVVVDRLLLGRVDYRDVRTALGRELSDAQDLDQVREEVSTCIARALTATSVVWREAATPAIDLARASLVTTDGGASAVMLVQTTDAPAFEISIAALANGRRLLSDDVAFLEHVALLAARRIDELRVARERYHQELREHEMQRLTAEAELRALRAQLNPHFLFNALTTIAHLVQTSPSRAQATLFQLTSLLRSVLRRATRDFVTLRDEMQIIDAYLAIERARFEERLTVVRMVPPEVEDLAIPPLVMQPLVENAIKHGIASIAEGGTVRIVAELLPAGEVDASGVAAIEPILQITISDTGAGVAMEELHRRRRQGVGLSNVERRLAQYYGPRFAMDLSSAPGLGMRVSLRIPVTRSAAAHTGSMDVHRMGA